MQAAEIGAATQPNIYKLDCCKNMFIYNGGKKNFFFFFFSPLKLLFNVYTNDAEIDIYYGERYICVFIINIYILRLGSQLQLN